MNTSPHTHPLTLAAAYRDYFDIGVAINPVSLAGHKDLIKTQFSSVTCENEMKFDALHLRPGEYTFEQADATVGFAVANGMKVRGHTLVWHYQTHPRFFQDDQGNAVDKATLYARMREHISTVVKRYVGKVYCWDVVNEAIADTKDDYLRPHSPYTQIVGSEEFIEMAFRHAHETDPAALLFYNDYDLERPEKREKAYRLLSSLIAKGVPVHGLGIQAHYDINLDVNVLRETIDLFASLGIVIHITELDVSIYDRFTERDLKYDVFPEDRVRRQTELYGEIFALLREKKDCIGNVTFWGLSDAHTWLTSFVAVRKDCPLLFDRDQKPKEAYRRVVNF